MSGREAGLRVEGRAWVFGHNVDTDQMAPLSAMGLPPGERKRKLFPTKPEFGRGMEAGDIIVAGRNWGCGSSREQAPANLKELGVAAVVAESFSRIFFRNSVAIGLIALECPGISEATREGDIVTVDALAATVANAQRATVLAARPYTPLMIEILRAGGLLEVLAARMGATRS